MRTTLDIADDMLAAAKAIAREQGKTFGHVLSELARAGMQRAAPLAFRNRVPLSAAKSPGAMESLRHFVVEVSATRYRGPRLRAHCHDSVTLV
jgi:hypothetical protein